MIKEEHRNNLVSLREEMRVITGKREIVTITETAVAETAGGNIVWKIKREAVINNSLSFYL